MRKVFYTIAKAPFSTRTLSHVDQSTGLPTMVDVTSKAATTRVATASSTVRFPPHVAAVLFPTTQLRAHEQFDIGSATDIHVAKGAVLTTAIVAGTMAAKNTSQVIPFCHPLPIESIKFKAYVAPTPQSVNETSALGSASSSVRLAVAGADVVVSCTVRTTHKTGVEMEALSGASVAALTIYDMCKALSHDIEIVSTKLVEKLGGKSDINRNGADKEENKQQ